MRIPVQKKNNAARDRARPDQNPEEEIAHLRKELGDMEWACRKTNDGIKILYKDLEWKNEELKKLDKLRSKFVSTVSHELRTPLAIIIQAIENLLAGAFGPVPEKQRLWLDRINENAEHLSGLLAEILDLSKLENGKEERKLERFDMSDLVRHCVDNMQPLAQKKNISLLLEIPPASPTVWASSRQLFQVMTNLMGNALKFSPAGGKITVAFEEDKSTVRVSVTDTGPGISAEDLKKIFDPFVQVENDSSENVSTKGIGLGLTICREIVHLHKGRIWAESEPGHGSRFVFEIPRESQ